MDLEITNFGNILEELSELKKTITNIQTKIRSLEKKSITKDKKLENLKKGKKRGRSKKGISKPVRISEKLCEFMNLEKGMEMARTDVTKYLNQYIKEKGLQNEQNRTIINPDDKLKNLLNINETQEEKLTYFTIQKYMNAHFIK